jgi:hypothetical protein
VGAKLWQQAQFVAAGESRGSEFESIKMITSEAAADGRLSLPLGDSPV